MFNPHKKMYDVVMMFIVVVKGHPQKELTYGDVENSQGVGETSL